MYAQSSLNMFRVTWWFLLAMLPARYCYVSICIIFNYINLQQLEQSRNSFVYWWLFHRGLNYENCSFCLLYIPAIRYFVQWNHWWIASLWTGHKPERRIIFFFCRMYLPPGPNEWKGILLYWISHIPRKSCLMCWYIHHRCLCLYWNKLSSYCKIINLCVYQIYPQTLITFAILH